MQIRCSILLSLISVGITLAACSGLNPTDARVDSPDDILPRKQQTGVPKDSPTTGQSSVVEEVVASPSPMPMADPTVPQASATNTSFPTIPPTPLTCLVEGGQIVRGVWHTDLLRLPMDYRVYLPPCYQSQPEKRYPVLILIHGQSFNDDQWDRLGADEMADQLIASGEVRPFMIVMPRDRYGGQPSENNFGRVVVEELLPYIDSTYRTLAEREYRAVGGLSRGAGWSVHLALNYWELFGTLGAHSPAIFYDDAQHMRSLLDAIPPESYPRIYIDLGDKDRPEIIDVAYWFEDLLNERDIPHEWHLFSGYHEEAYWQAHVEGYLRWYTLDW